MSFFHMWVVFHPKASKDLQSPPGLWRSSANCSFTRADDCRFSCWSMVGRDWGRHFQQRETKRPYSHGNLRYPPKATPPQEIRPYWRDYEPLVSLSKALLGAYFLRGWHWWGYLEFPWYSRKMNRFGEITTAHLEQNSNDGSCVADTSCEQTLHKWSTNPYYELETMLPCFSRVTVVLRQHLGRAAVGHTSYRIGTVFGKTVLCRGVGFFSLCFLFGVKAKSNASI